MGLRFTLVVALAAAVLTGPPAASARGATAQPPVNADAKTMAEFDKRVQDYVALHRKLEGTLTNLPNEATPQQIDDHQRALGKLIQQARANAKPGDLFTRRHAERRAPVAGAGLPRAGRTAGETVHPRRVHRDPRGCR